MRNLTEAEREFRDTEWYKFSGSFVHTRIPGNTGYGAGFTAGLDYQTKRIADLEAQVGKLQAELDSQSDGYRQAAKRVESKNAEAYRRAALKAIGPGMEL